MDVLFPPSPTLYFYLFLSDLVCNLFFIHFLNILLPRGRRRYTHFEEIEATPFHSGQAHPAESETRLINPKEILDFYFAQIL